MRLLPFRHRPNGPKKYRLTRLATRVESFLASIWSKKLVLVTSTLLFVTGYYVNNFFVGIPEQLRDTEQEHEIRTDQIMQEVHKWSDTYQKLQLFAGSLSATFHNVQDLGSGVNIVSTSDDKTSYSIDRVAVQACFTRIEDSRDKLITALAAVKTSNFQRPEFVDFYKGYEDDLRAIDLMLANYEALYQSVLASNFTNLAVATQRLQQDRFKFQEASEVLEERTRMSLQRIDNINKSIHVLQTKQDWGEIALASRSLILLGLITLTVFSAVFTYKLRKPKPPPFPITPIQLELSRSQRQKYRAMRRRSQNRGKRST